MATEYADPKEKTLLLKIRGVDFLEDLKRSGEDFECLLLDQEGIVAYERIRIGEISDEASIRGFFTRNTKPVRDVSLRKLRQAAEVIVFFPKNVHTLPFHKGHTRIVPASNDDYASGDYHQTKVRVASKLEGHYQKRDQKIKALKKEIQEVSKEHEALFKQLSSESLPKTDMKRSLLDAKCDELFSRLLELRLSLAALEELFVYPLSDATRTHRQANRQTAITESEDS